MTAEGSARVAARPPVSESCVSDMVLDAVVTGGRARGEIDSHLSACGRCRERLALFERHHSTAGEQVEAMLRVARVRAALGSPAPRVRFGAWAAAGVALAAAAILLVAVVPERSSTPAAPPGDGVRMKGTSVRFFAKRDGVVRRGASGRVYRPGTSLQLAVTSDRPGYLFVVGVEETGKISAYHPFGGVVSAQLKAEIDKRLPHSLLLDDSLATEYFLAVFSHQPLELDRIRAAIRETERHGAYDLEGLRRVDLPGSLHFIEIRKR